MERPIFSEQERRPELDENQPGSLFIAAKAMERWIRWRVKEEDRPKAIDNLVNDLERFVTKVFDGELPGVTIQGDDITYTVGVYEVESGEYRMKTAMLPLKGDAEVFGEHVIEGVFDRFYRGRKNDLRVFVSRLEEPIITPGGIITPLYSVGIRTSEITLTTDKKEELLKGPLSYIHESLLAYGEDTLKDVDTLLDVLDQSQTAIKPRLLDSSAIIAKIEKESKPSGQFIDALLEVICLKLDIASPQDLEVKQRRVFYTDHPTPAYRIEGPATLYDIKAQLEMIGSFDDKMLSLHFLDNNQRTIHVPVRDIVHIQKSKPKLL